MNHTELIMEISARTGISSADCDKVIHTFEELLTEGFSDKKWKGRTFDRVVRMMNSIRDRKKGSDTAEKK